MIYTRYTSSSNCIEMFTIIHYFLHWYWLHCALTLSNCNHTVIQSHQHTLDLKWQWICRPEAHGHGWVNHAAMTHLCHDAAPRTALPLIYYTGHGRHLVCSDAVEENGNQRIVECHFPNSSNVRRGDG